MNVIPRGPISLCAAQEGYEERARNSDFVRLSFQISTVLRTPTSHVKQYLLEARWSLVRFSAKCPVPVSPELTPARSEL